jgi:hypothetical protein
MAHSALLDALATKARSEAVVARALSACDDAVAAREAARSLQLHAIEVRCASRRHRRDFHGPIYAMAEGSRYGVTALVHELAQLAITLGVEGADVDEAAVELLAVSRRSRQAIEIAVARFNYVQPGDDVDQAVVFLNEALKLGDRNNHWVDLRP